MIKMHHTKCTNITNVLIPHFEKELTDDIGSNKLSLLLDKGNDISIIKLLVSIIYFSHASNEVKCTYLGLTQLEKLDANNIVTALNFFFFTNNLNINNCIAIGTDNASVMVGINNGVYS